MEDTFAAAVSILQNYAACAESEDIDGRKKAATGLSQLAELYAKIDPKLLGEALRHLGLRLSVEQDAELQALVSAAVVRLSQQAASNRCFPAMEQALDLVAGVESQRPGIAQTLRSKMGIEERVPEFVVGYVMYHEMLHVKHPMRFARCRRESHGPAFRKEEKKFADYIRAMKFLDRFPVR